MSTNSGRLMPSIPTWYRAPIAGIHFAFELELEPGARAVVEAERDRDRDDERRAA